MAQNGPHSHQYGGAASDDGHSAPPTTVAFSPTSTSPYGNGGSSAGNMETTDAGGVGKQNLIPDLNMEMEDPDSEGGSKDKPRELNVNISLERERRKKMKDLLNELRDLIPHVPHQKTDRVTLVGEAIKYIKVLEKKTAAMVGMHKQARQAAARGDASSSFSSTTAMPQTAQGMAGLLDVLRGWGGVLHPVPLPPAPAMPASPIRFRTWSGPNVALTMANDNAYICVCAPRRANTLTMVMSVLDNHGIDVVTAQISSDSIRSLFLIFAHVTGIDGANTSPEQVCQRAMSEIMLRLNSNN